MDPDSIVPDSPSEESQTGDGSDLDMFPTRTDDVFGNESSKSLCDNFDNFDGLAARKQFGKRQFEGYTPHALERRAERGIKDAYVRLCQSRGVRTNVPNGDPAHPWRHKYMLHGLYVVTEVATGRVVTAYWAPRQESQIAACIGVYDRLLAQRRDKTERHREHAVQRERRARERKDARAQANGESRRREKRRR